MSSMTKIIGKALPNMPWQEKPEGYTMPVWRYSENPIIERRAIPSSNSIFNSAVVPFKDGYAGVFRCDSKSISYEGKSTIKISEIDTKRFVFCFSFYIGRTEQKVRK